MSLGDRLRGARLDKGLKQVDVKVHTGINNKTLSNYEKNVSSPDPDTLKILAELYDVTTDYLLNRTINRTESSSSNINTNQTKNETQPSQFSPDELALIEKYRKMKDEDKDTLHKVANYISPDQLATVSNK